MKRQFSKIQKGIKMQLLENNGKDKSGSDSSSSSDEEDEKDNI